MQERLLQFIWRGKYFNLNGLTTESGEALTIIDAGTYNTSQGPDFLDARIILSGTHWAGNIELHVKSSHWYQHRHQADPNYQNIILHVVWQNDDRELSKLIPTLVLESRVPALLLERYRKLMDQTQSLPCSELLEKVPASLWKDWGLQLLNQRLERKAALVLERLELAGKNWEECSWWWMARHFGGLVNAEFFEQVARSIPLKIILRHRNQIIQLEAMLLGQANLLSAANTDPYVQLLQREYRFLQNKYRFMPVHGQAQRLRMRPAGFPAIRLAQLAMFLHRWGAINARLLTCQEGRDLEYLLDITANDFWHYHFTLEEATPFQPKHLGREMSQQLIINAISPIVYAMGKQLQQPHLLQRVRNWLEWLPAEKNSLVRVWTREGISVDSAAISQAMTELNKYYCSCRRCLDCRVGQFLLNR
jgi:hypothetical protein